MRNGKIIRSQQEALDVVDDYMAVRPSRIAVDTETTGLDWTKDELFLVQVGWGWNANYAFPVKFLRYLLPILEDPNSEKVLANAKFDMHMLERAGIKLAGKIHDVQVMARLLLPQNHRGKRIKLSLKNLAVTFVDTDAADPEIKLKRWLMAEKRRRSSQLTAALREIGVKRKDYDAWVREGLPLPPEVEKVASSINLEPTYEDVPDEIMEPYATGDVKYTLALFNKFWPMIQANQLVPVYERDMRTLLYAYNWEKTGMAVDLDVLEEGIRHGEKMLAHIQKKFQELAGREVNLDSPDQILKLFNERGIQIDNTESETLEAIADKEPLADLLLKYRGYRKEIGTYYKPIYEKASRCGGRIHGTFNVAGPVTGRFSSSDPNLQNIPKEPIDEKLAIRRAFVPTPGYIYVFIDYAQMEVVIMAEYSKDENLVQAILNKEDLHTKTALEIDPRAKEFYIPGKPKDDQPKEFQRIRSAAKRTTFGIFYGIGAQKLAKQIKVDVDTARMYIQNFFTLYPGIKRFIDAVQATASRRPGNYVINKFGRIYWGEPGYEYKLVDYLIQGTCADMMKIAIDRCEKILAGLKSRLISMVHDELIFEVALDELDVIPLLAEQMTYWPELEMPIEVDISYSTTSWADKKPWRGKEAFLREYQGHVLQPVG